MAWLANRAHFIPRSDDEIFNAFEKSGFKDIFVSCNAPCLPGDYSFGAGTIDLTEQRNGKMLATVKAGGPALLVISQNNLPGWAVRIDGHAGELLTVNTVFLGVRIAPGAHRVELTYSNPCSPAKLYECLSGLVASRSH